MLGIEPHSLFSFLLVLSPLTSQLLSPKLLSFSFI
ncbi:hypothetical protein BVRB_6g144380 [Beta vulgaris subsp. vulgaris]|nr:hypothetical protein BVRB_6g144380 [Beta vulgaris subsp. vulgaris]